MGSVTPFTPTTAPRDPGYFPTLDGWRAISIFLVLCYHVNLSIPGKPLWAKLINFHQTGVEIFFVISGFLITSLLVREFDQKHSISLKAFYVRRFFRIVPAQVLFLTVVAAMFLAGLVDTSWPMLAASLLFVRNFFGGDWATGHFWSLAIEEQFYFCWPFALLVFSRRGNRFSLLAIALAALTAWQCLDHHFHWVGSAFPSIAAWTRTDMRVTPLLWGTLAALALADASARKYVDRAMKGFLPLLGVLVVARAAVAFEPLQRTFLSLIAVVAILGTIRHSTSIVGRILESRPLRWVGRRSYGMYLWQQIFMFPAGDATWLPFSGVAGAAFAFVAVPAVAALSYRLLEQPLLRRGHRLSEALLARADAAFSPPSGSSSYGQRKAQ